MDINKVTYSLASLFEITYQIENIITNNIVDVNSIGNLVKAVLKTESQETEKIYSKYGLKNGFQYLADSSKFDKDTSKKMIFYSKNSIRLTEIYLNNTDLRTNLSNKINSIRCNLANYEGKEKLNYVCKELADWYNTNITKNNLFAFQLICNQNTKSSLEKNIIYIRALIVAAIRAQILFCQTGGAGLSLLFKKSQISICAQYTLKNLGV